MTETKNFHTDPRELVVEAAERSGRLEEIAELLWFVKKHGRADWCAPCMLLEELTEAFDNHICMAAVVGERVYGGGCDGLDISPWRDGEAAEFETYFAQFRSPDQEAA